MIDTIFHLMTPEQLKEERKKYKRTQQDVALAMDISVRQYQNYESGVTTIDEKLEKQLLRAIHENIPILGNDFRLPNLMALEDRAAIVVLMKEVAKLQAKFYGRDVVDCKNELLQNTRIEAEDMRKAGS